MYFIIYDHSLTEGKYRRPLAQLETSLTDRGIAFKTAKLTLLKSVTDMAEFGIRQGAHTIVGVGGDRLIGSIINTIAHHPDITLGVVPMGGVGHIAEFLGVLEGRAAHEILSARKIELVDLAQINDHFFLLSAEAQDPSTPITLEFNDDWSVSPLSQAQLVGVYNFNYRVPREMQKTNPQDGWLNTIIVPQRPARIPVLQRRDFSWGNETDIPTRHVRMTSASPATIIVDCERVFKTPLTITLSHHRIKVIVGKDRLF